MDCEKELLNAMVDSMLMDTITTNAYNRIFKRQESIFKDKIVLDVGCRSGLLSLMSVEAGAVKVIGVGNMQSAKIVKKALSGGEKEDIFEMVEGSIENIRLPCGLKKVDIIVSEWIGKVFYKSHSVFVDSLFKEVIFARDKWLTKGGHIIPNIARLFISGISKHHRPSVSVSILEKDHPDHQHSVQEPVCLIEGYVTKDQLITEKFLLRKIDLRTADSDDDVFRVKFKLKGLEDGPLGAMVLHSDISFARIGGGGRLLFSTSPKHPRTYLKQTIMFLDDNVTVAKDQLLHGALGLYRNPEEYRGVQFSLAFDRIDGVSS
ncbi:hypothetical protein KR009_004981, partial [Drosophila setifemur]